MSAPRIVLVGATGFTGRLVAHALADGDDEFLLTARDARALAGLAQEVGGAETLPVDVDRPGSLRRALRAGDTVINCAGPFTHLGEPVVDACVRIGCHYLDTTGEQLFMKRVFDRFDRAARAAGLAVVNAVAFEYALGDCAAALAAARLAAPLHAADLTYAWHGAATASRGTRLSVLQVVRDGGFAFQDGAWQPRPTGAERTRITLPDGRRRNALWFPAGEILTVPRHLDVRHVRAWMVVGRWTAAIVPSIAPALPALAAITAPAARRIVSRGPQGPDPQARRNARFRIVARVTDRDGRAAAVAVEGHDTYGLTARIAVHAAHRLRHRPPPARGVLAPAQLLHPPAFRRAAAEWGTSWHDARVDPDCP